MRPIVAAAASTLALVNSQNSAASLIKWHTYSVKTSSDNPLERKFAEALESRVDAYMAAGIEIPQHITDTVLATMAGGSADRASAFCPQPGGCQATISLEQVWSYGCWCMLSDGPTAGFGTALAYTYKPSYSSQSR